MSTRNSYLLRTYGITEAQYLELFQKQSGCCAICGKHQSELKVRLSVEHNHASKEIRGLCCNFCNLRIIGRHTKGDLLKRAGEYLETAHTGWFVPIKKRKKR